MFRSPFYMTFGVVLFVGLIRWAFAADLEHTKDTLETVKEKIAEKKAVLVDVRTPEEWDAGHVNDAVHLPLDRLQKNASLDDVANLLKKDQIAYIYCRSGRRSLLAGEILAKMGYEVRPLKPGYQDLIKAGFTKAEDK